MSLKLSSILILISMLLSCSEEKAIDYSISKEELTPISINEIEQIDFEESKTLLDYVTNQANGYYKSKQIDEINFSLLRKPKDYIKALKQLKSNEEVNLEKDDLQYFDLRIKVDHFNMEFMKYNLPSSNDYGTRVSYYAFEFQKKIFLIDGKDTLPCVLYHFERTYDITPFGHFTLAFPPSKNKTQICAKTVFFPDEIFHKGIIKFTYIPENLIKVPKLNYL